MAVSPIGSGRAKLQAPRLGRDLIARDHLFERLDAGLQSNLILVSAPAFSTLERLLLRAHSKGLKYRLYVSDGPRSNSGPTVAQSWRMSRRNFMASRPAAIAGTQCAMNMISDKRTSLNVSVLDMRGTCRFMAEPFSLS